MNFKRSTSVKKNFTTWTKNLTRFQEASTKCRDIQNTELSLSELNKKPKEKYIIGRFNSLAKDKKNKKERYFKIAQELSELWIKLNIKKMQMHNIKRKVENLIILYRKNVQHPNGKPIGDKFNKIFDITTVSDVLKCEPEPFPDSDSSTMFHSDDDDEDLDFTPSARSKNSKLSLNPAVKLVNNANLSTNKAAKVCKQLAESGIDIATPSQSGIYRAVIKSAENLEEFYKKTLQNEEWCLHFDGKKIGNKEIQVIVIKNERREIKLAVLLLENGRALTIFNGIKETLNKFNLWRSVKMIVCDTTSVNTGRINGVVALLKKHFQSISLPLPQYIGCQHHVLDLLLRHVMDEVLGGATSSPNIGYSFVSELVNNYEHLRRSYGQNTVVIKHANVKWRDDMQFLYELCKSYRYYKKNGIFPYINLKTLPPISNARWNSRAILAILAYVLIPKYQEMLQPICDFICEAWCDVWFSDHCFNENNFSALNNSTTKYKKAHACFLKHWVSVSSAIPNQQRSNICAERAIKIAQDIFVYSKTSRTLNLKFISFNPEP